MCDARGFMLDNQSLLITLHMDPFKSMKYLSLFLSKCLFIVLTLWVCVFSSISPSTLSLWRPLPPPKKKKTKKKNTYTFTSISILAFPPFFSPPPPSLSLCVSLTPSLNPSLSISLSVYLSLLFSHT